MEAEKVILRPIVLTEKARTLSETSNQYVFEVARTANKIEIGNAVEKLFGVKVKGVSTLVVRGKMRHMGRGYAKTQNWKKAIVTLKAGDKIGFFDAELNTAPSDETQGS